VCYLHHSGFLILAQRLLCCQMSLLCSSATLIPNLFEDTVLARLLECSLFFKSDIKVLSSWYEELKIANSAFHNVGWQRQAVQGHRRCHCA
jgi:hypothetical protein